VSDDPDNLPDEEALLPDERPRRSRHEKPLTLFLAPSDGERVADRPGEGSHVLPALEINQPFDLQPSTAADPPRRKSRGKQGRDPVCSKYRMAWVLVFFDLPVGSPEERRDATNFRKDLIKDGYFMVQFSVYARPCGTADRVETQVRRLKSKIPAHGEVRGLMISDAQWGRMIIMRSQQKADAEKMPAQMQFF
jgi:CRISPR-associated protein Cas2